jgi:glycosyltransferase involved in cell wall biosynthesis
MSNSRIIITFPEAILDSIPCLCNIITLLSTNGYKIDLMIYHDSDHILPKFNRNVKTHILYSRRYIFKNNNGNITHIINTLYNLVLIVYYKIKKMSLLSLFILRNSIKKYTCVIGINPTGIIMGYRYSQRLNVPIIYYSLELLLSSELSTIEEKRIKPQELMISKKSKFIIIYDLERAKLLSKDNDIPIEKFVIIPNSAPGSARRNKTRYWHNKFNLSAEKRIVLYTGSLGEWTGVSEIIESAIFWPRDWILVVHTRDNSESSDEYEKLKRIPNNGNVYFSVKPVPRLEYDALIDGADIGIAFYKIVPGSPFTMNNITFMGLCSGKLAYYLRSGLPVIINNVTSASDFVIQEKCGVSVTSKDEVSQAISTIAMDYEKFSQNSLDAYGKYFDISKYFTQLVENIEN